jgi:hypothetical protein
VWSWQEWYASIISAVSFITVFMNRFDNWPPPPLVGQFFFPLNQLASLCISGRCGSPPAWISSAGFWSTPYVLLLSPYSGNSETDMFIYIYIYIYIYITRKWTFRIHKIWGISWLVQGILFPQEGCLLHGFVHMTFYTAMLVRITSFLRMLNKILTASAL